MEVSGVIMKAIQSQWGVAAALVFTGFLFIGCGSSSTSESGFGSNQSSSTSPSTPEAISQQDLATCSQASSSSGDLKVQLMQFVDMYGQPRADYVRLKFSKVPSAWQTNNRDLLIYRWSASPNNSAFIDPTPLRYQFERSMGSGFQILAPEAYQVINWQDIEQYALATQVKANSPQEFITNTSLLVNLRDSSNSFQVLRVVFRENGQEVQKLDLLIPSFAADPARYNADSRHPTMLQALHPLRDKLGQNWPQATYQEFARSFCF